VASGATQDVQAGEFPSLSRHSSLVWQIEWLATGVLHTKAVPSPERDPT